MKSFPEILKDVCYRIGKTQTELAEFLMIDESTLSGWKKRPTTKWFPHVINLCEAHEWDLNIIFFGKGYQIGDYVGLDGLNHDQRTLIARIEKDRGFARALMVFYKNVSDQLREEEKVKAQPPAEKPVPLKVSSASRRIPQDPNLVSADTGDDEPPKEEKL